ncbi:MAG TPA: Ppx/GppA phosphatase family protein [Thermoanaerobaculia bacterium]|nr:Ppx/GppA phosphatase family protein [Thermoanaerobaculia bacterium]
MSGARATTPAAGPAAGGEALSPATATSQVGIVDLGSNTARLVVFSYDPPSWFRLTDSIRERVRLAAGMGEDGRLRPDAVERALAALQLFADYAEGAGLDRVDVVATSAVRDAVNGGDLVRRIEALGMPVRVLSGAQEAELGVIAVANGFPWPDAWVVDLGGGSVQVSQMRERRFASGRAHPLGAVRLTERYFGLGGDGSAPPTAKQVARLEAEIARHLEADGRALRGDADPLVALGGTARSLAAAAQKADRYPLDLLHGYRLERAALEDLTGRLLSKTVAERAAIAGINPDRADLILAGALVLRWLLRHGERDHLVISGDGVREGALFQHLLPPPHLLDDVRAFASRNLFRHYAQPAAHTEAVRRLSTELFDGLQPLHGLGPAERELLQHAALLHDIGMTVSYYRHHRHGAFLIENSGLAGFSHREIALLALIVRGHRKGGLGAGALAPLLDPGDLERLRALAVCLRIAEHLERSRSGKIRSVRVEVRKRAVRLLLVAPSRPTVEIWEAEKDARIFDGVFGRRLEIEHLDAGG